MLYRPVVPRSQKKAKNSDAQQPAPPGHVKVAVEFRHHWRDVPVEVMWAVPRGGDRYELRNVPFYAYGLNWGDVVQASQRADDEHPVVEAVVTAGGHRTIRFDMDEATAEERSVAMLEALEQLGAGCERHSGGFVAIDVPPDVDYDAVFDQLEAWADEELLDFETCERRVDDDFGSDPDDE
jgi:hypothetical protein